jgi:hypothetical protein
MTRKRYLHLMIVCGGLACAGLGQTAGGDAPRLLRFRLELNSMEPARLTVPEGRYLVQVINGVALSPVSVQLDDEQATRIAEARSKRGAARTRFPVSLRPGKHTLSVRGRPEWKSVITVVSR